MSTDPFADSDDALAAAVPDFDALALLHLDGLADAKQIATLETALRDDPDAAGRLVRLAERHALLGELAKPAPSAPASMPATASAPTVFPTSATPNQLRRAGNSTRWSRLRQAPRRVPMAMTLLIAVVAISMGLAVGLHRQSVTATSATDAQLVSVSGEVLLRRDGHTVPAHTPCVLLSEDRVTTTNGGRAQLRWLDGTRIDLAQHSTLSIADGHQGTRLHLADGELVADVSPQPSGRPMIISTPHADLTVLGTHCTVTAHPDRSTLAVEHGRVRITNHDDNGSTTITSGESVSTSGRGTFAARTTIEASDAGTSISSAPPQPAPAHRHFGGTGLTGDYYDNVDFTAWCFRRIDPVVDFNWHRAAPDLRMAPETFSIRWTGAIAVPTDGDYTFAVTVDDGVRLWIDDKLLIDEWHLNEPVTFASGIHLDAGRRHALRLDYYQNPHLAQVALRWSGPGLPQQVIPSDYLFPDETPR